MKTLSAVRLPLAFDAAALKQDLARIGTELWSPHFNRAIFEGDWSGVALRAVPGGHLPIYSDPSRTDDWADTPLLADCPGLRAALERFACPLLSVRLLRLAPGGRIKPHRDFALGLDYGEVRLHVVIATNPQVEVCIDGNLYQWAEGECWYGDFGRFHSMANGGGEDRIHLVLDCRVNDWLRRLIAGAAEAV